jgi:hypothetical protein
MGFVKNAGTPLQWSGAWEVSLRTPDGKSPSAPQKSREVSLRTPDSRRERSEKILNSNTQSPKSPTLTDSVSEHSFVRLYQALQRACSTKLY